MHDTAGDLTGHLAPNEVPGAVAIHARHRLPLDVVGEMLARLADEPPLLLCDLNGLAPVGGDRLVADLQPVSDYLHQWPGTVVVLHTSDEVVHAQLTAAGLGELVVVTDSWIQAIPESVARLPMVSCLRKYLAPVPGAAREARVFVSRILQAWELSHLVDPAVLVVSELVTNAHLHARTVLDLSVSHTEDRLRIAVGDHGGGTPAMRTRPILEMELNGRGMMLVRALAQGWGVLPGRSVGKTVWVVLDNAVPVTP